ncbi:5-hydroxyisourate hydrolase [Paenibacillus polysaccharolyticus]|uniref:5-hydroxyisourate hydrolase n=1 Tax=Paenibacillus polysaccharolyticus TaxID=582692 RepID=A0A1G5LKC9_9BACL|nr:hydroxyisourate hydrolase [Paenibacillus polysaccharolyticus]SCZ13395.1 5-hydroxyisourate hydrolase [Paenibacillus polysaccharolyticus]
MQPNAGRITTHVLDTSKGAPAVGVRIELYFIKWSGNEWNALKVAESLTNSDGRLNEPLLHEGKLEVGEYELRFDVKPYFAQDAQTDMTYVLWTEVPIRFEVRDTGSHYHIPLLIAPGGYSTYRGS